MIICAYFLIGFAVMLYDTIVSWWELKNEPYSVLVLAQMIVIFTWPLYLFKWTP